MALIKIKKVAKGYEETYKQQALRKNLNIFLPFSVASIIVMVGLLFFQYARLGAELFLISYIYIYLSVFLVSTVFFFLYRSYKKGKIIKYQNIVDFLFAISFAVLAVATSAQELNYGSTQSIILIIYTFFIATIMYFDLKILWTIILLTNLSYGILIGMSSISSLMKYENILNIAYPIIIIFVATIIFHNDRVERFNQKIELENANIILKRANLTLANLNKRLEKTAVTDALTGILNRLAFNNSIDISWENALLTNEPISVIMLDIDHFKKYNDSYGHMEGDKCLRTIATTMVKSLKRSGDEIYRYGGEEFVALLPGIDLAGAEIVAKRILRYVEDLKIARNDLNDIVTISAGVHSVVPSKDDNKSDLVDKADKALYFAKQNGRKQVVCYDKIPELNK